MYHLFLISFIFYSLVFGFRDNHLKTYKKLLAHIVTFCYFFIFHQREYFIFYQIPQYINSLPVFYFIEAGYYIQDIISYLWEGIIQKKISNKDLLMIVHHFFSILLLWLSYDDFLCSYGYVVIWNHLIDDIIAHSSKVIKHYNKNSLSNPNPKLKILSDFLFILSNITWAYHRIFKQGIFLLTIHLEMLCYTFFKKSFTGIDIEYVSYLAFHSNSNMGTILLCIFLLDLLWISNTIWWRGQIKKIRPIVIGYWNQFK